MRLEKLKINLRIPLQVESTSPFRKCSSEKQLSISGSGLGRNTEYAVVFLAFLKTHFWLQWEPALSGYICLLCDTLQPLYVEQELWNTGELPGLFLMHVLWVPSERGRYTGCNDKRYKWKLLPKEILYLGYFEFFQRLLYIRLSMQIMYFWSVSNHLGLKD